MTEALVPVVIISLDDHKGYAIPFESEDDIQHLADDIVSAEFDYLDDDDASLLVKMDSFNDTTRKRFIGVLIRTWARGLLFNSLPKLMDAAYAERQTFYITDSDDRKIGLHPELKTREWVEALDETDFEGW
jgi:hypothetical protein